jgi:hypothetical protein
MPLGDRCGDAVGEASGPPSPAKPRRTRTQAAAAAAAVLPQDPE